MRPHSPGCCGRLSGRNGQAPRLQPTRDKAAAPISASGSSAGRDEFVAAISHELRTPLNAILGFGRLARADWPVGVDRQHLDHIEQAARLMLRVVNDLLDLTRLEAGKLSMDADQPLSMSAVVSRVGALAASLRLNKPVRLYASVDPTCPAQMRGDAERIEQILLNLVANALKFTDRGRIVIEVRCKAVREGRALLRVSVSDTGAGIPMDQIERLGQPFEQIGNLSLPKIGGSGLGLAVVNRLLTLLDARLRVASVPGGGSLFWFDIDLPFDEPPPSAAHSAHSAQTVLVSDDERLVRTVGTQWAAQGAALMAPKQAELAMMEAGSAQWIIDVAAPMGQAMADQAKQRGELVYWVSADPVTDAGDVLALPLLAEAVFRTRRDDSLTVDPQLLGLKVLAVEDNPLNQHVLREFLRRIGVDVTLVGEGRPAIELQGQRHFDLILLDIQLPDLSGWEIARAMRSRPHGENLPIVFLSAHIDANDQRAAAALGALACMSKPFDAAQLHALMREVALQAGVANRAFQPTSTSAEASVDLLASRLPDVRTPLMALFASQWPALRQSLEQAPDAAALRQAIHALRGSLAVLGQAELVTMARQHEETLLAGRVVTTDALSAFLRAVEACLTGS